MKQILFYFLLLFMMLILVMIMMLISVAFLTLMERKILGYVQLRKGPNKLGILGILQSFSDAIKLLSKESIYLKSVNIYIYYISPMFMLMMVFMIWLIYPFLTNLMMMNLGLIYLMCCLSFMIYGLIFAGWSSNSSYSMLGSIRSLSQSISYEVSLSLLMFLLIMVMESFNLINLFYIQEVFWIFMFLSPLVLMFLISMLAELNRIPFDFSEGESELVSGFNVEYMSVGFVMIFLSEYSSIIFTSFLFSMFFLGGNYMNLLFYFKVMFIIMFILLIRGSMPRFRYDLLMYFCWMMILPFILNYMFYIYILKLMVFK